MKASFFKSPRFPTGLCGSFRNDMPANPPSYEETYYATMTSPLAINSPSYISCHHVLTHCWKPIIGSLAKSRPKVAILPWGATEAHNYHLPYGTDVIEATRIAERAAELAHDRGASVIVLPTIPFGNDEQQLDQACTISFPRRRHWRFSVMWPARLCGRVSIGW